MKLNNNNKVKVIPLGGLGEIGKNITAIEYDNEIIVIDCGLAFPSIDMQGIDLVIPDIKYLIKNKDKVKAIVLTHGHEDHIGAIPYILKDINVPIYGTKFTLNLLKSRLEERKISSTNNLHDVKVGDKVHTNNFCVEFIRTCHSIADACALAITTPEGIIVHTGDFKIDHTPVDSELIDLNRFAELGAQGVLLMMADSTNAQREGHTISEKEIGKNLDSLFPNANGRVIVASFASNINRIQQIINSSLNHNRKVVFNGRSMERVCKIAIESGYLNIPKEKIINIYDINKYPSNEITIITTGSQGEPMAALSRIANEQHKHISIQKDDFIIISASPIPGNQKAVSSLIDKLFKSGAKVIYDEIEEVHVSGHACKNELRLIHALIKPKFFIPVHGEYRHLVEHKLLAKDLGMKSENIFIMENGGVLELNKHSAKKLGTVEHGSILIDGLGIGDVGNIVLRDRKGLGEDGVVTIVMTIDDNECTLLTGPDILTRGFVYVRESEELINQLKYIANYEVEMCLSNQIKEWSQIKYNLKSKIGDYIYKETRRRPIILPIIKNIKTTKNLGCINLTYS
jgi:beta-CASP RNase J family ribonuclease